MLDLTDKIIQTPTRRPTPLQAPNGNVRWHVPRRVLQMLCGVLFAALPLTNGLRLDVRRDEFYFAWHKMAAHDLFLLFWVAMLGVSLLMAVSFLYGRLWCGWVCPQTLASDFADSLKARLDQVFRTRPGRPGFGVSRALWAGSILTVSLATGAVFACYWLAPATVWAALLAPGRDLSAALTVYLTGGVLAADMLWVRRRFCAHACPYGPLLSTLTDQNTLAVRFLSERADECIGCHKCETDCPMEIDIKNGVGQHGCIGCGECVDSCNDVLGKRGAAGLIEFRYGTDPARVTKQLTAAERWGLWDARRVAVVATVPLCLAAVLFLVFGQLPLSASVNANGAITRAAGQVRNGYTLTLGNNGPGDARFALSVSGLPSASVAPSSVVLRGHESRTVAVTVAAPLSSVQAGRTPVHLRVSSGHDRQEITTIFYTPSRE